MLASLDAERAATDPSSAELLLARHEAPGLFEAGVDLTRAQAHLAASEPTGWWFPRRRARRARGDLVALARCGPSVDDARLARLLEVATARRRAAELEALGGLELDDLWARLERAEASARTAIGDWLDAEVRHDERAHRRALRSMAAVAAALRSGRSERRRQLASMPGRDLTEALPVWIATLRDVDDLLPREAAMFDLVLLDEASQVDQISAAPALLRARRAVVCGDPRQLRHVSFTSDEAQRQAQASSGLPADLAGQLDVRRSSLFDAAAAVETTTFLDEHFRSLPHLIDFSARRFYDDRLRIATRTPATDVLDVIAVEPVDGEREGSGVNHAEVDAVLALLDGALAAAGPVGGPPGGSADGSPGATATVGVVTPFRAQADALDAAILERYDLDELDRLDLRSGTVHSLQGCERDHLVVSLALDAASAPGSRRFVDDPNLFNVMVTRGRRRATVVTSLPVDPVAADEPAAGLDGDTAPHGAAAPRSARRAGGDLIDAYLRHASAPGGHRRAPAEVSPWARRVAAHVEPGHALVGYVVGRHVVDVALASSSTGRAPVGLVCGVHPDGPEAHVERHLSLRAAGWRLVEVHETRWGDRLGELGVLLADLAERELPRAGSRGGGADREAPGAPT